MTQNQLIAVAAIVVPCATAIYVGYLHRKQMRHLEMSRRDPSVGVLPPPSPPVAFIKRYWGIILGVGVPLWGIVSFLMTSNGPLTNVSVVIICVCFACIVWNLNLSSENRLLEFLNRLLDIDNKTLDVLRDQVNRLTILHAELERMKKLKEISPNSDDAHPNT